MKKMFVWSRKLDVVILRIVLFCKITRGQILASKVTLRKKQQFAR